MLEGHASSSQLVVTLILCQVSITIVTYCHNFRKQCMGKKQHEICIRHAVVLRRDLECKRASKRRSTGGWSLDATAGVD